MGTDEKTAPAPTGTKPVPAPTEAERYERLSDDAMKRVQELQLKQADVAGRANTLRDQAKAKTEEARLAETRLKENKESVELTRKSIEGHEQDLRDALKRGDRAAADDAEEYAQAQRVNLQVQEKAIEQAQAQIDNARAESTRMTAEADVLRAESSEIISKATEIYNVSTELDRKADLLAKAGDLPEDAKQALADAQVVRDQQVAKLKEYRENSEKQEEAFLDHKEAEATANALKAEHDIVSKRLERMRDALEKSQEPGSGVSGADIEIQRQQLAWRQGRLNDVEERIKAAETRSTESKQLSDTLYKRAGELEKEVGDIRDQAIAADKRAVEIGGPAAEAANQAAQIHVDTKILEDEGIPVDEDMRTPTDEPDGSASDAAEPSAADPSEPDVQMPGLPATPAVEATDPDDLDSASRTDQTEATQADASQPDASQAEPGTARDPDDLDARSVAAASTAGSGDPAPAGPSEVPNLDPGPDTSEPGQAPEAEPEPQPEFKAPEVEPTVEPEPEPAPPPEPEPEPEPSFGGDSSDGGLGPDDGANETEIQEPEGADA